MEPEENALDTIIHIGAGRGKELGAHLSTGARRIILVDADRLAAAALRHQANSAASVSSSIDVIETAISGEEKMATLRIYNLARISGIGDPEALSELFPGLHLVRSSDIKTQPAADFVNALEISADKENKLVIDAPCEELSILENLAAEQLLRSFSSVAVQLADQPLHKNAPSSSDIVNFFKRNDYAASVDDDGRWSLVSAQRFRLQRDVFEIEGLKQDIEHLKQDIDSRKQDIASLKQDIEGHRNEYSLLQKEVQRVDALRATHEQKVVELSTENANLKGENQTQLAELQKLKHEIARIDAIRSTHAEKVTALSTENVNLAADVEKQKSEIAEHKKRVGELEESPADMLDRKLAFEAELLRCEAQFDLLKDFMSQDSRS